MDASFRRHAQWMALDADPGAGKISGTSLMKFPAILAPSAVYSHLPPPAPVPLQQSLPVMIRQTVREFFHEATLIKISLVLFSACVIIKLPEGESPPYGDKALLPLS